jgi:Phage integrase, N-terminal SAM-like domain
MESSMTKVIATEYVTLDGVVEARGTEDSLGTLGGWSFVFWNEEAAKFKLDELFVSDTLLLGRVTYEIFAASWPSITDEQGFADRMNSLPKYVVPFAFPLLAVWSSWLLVCYVAPPPVVIQFHNRRCPMTPLRQRMIEDMQLRGLAPLTQRAYLRAVRELARYYHKSPDLITEEELRHYFLYLLHEKQLARSTTTVIISGLKFFFEHTLRTPGPASTCSAHARPTPCR